MTNGIGCMGCRNFDIPIHHRSDLPSLGMLCDGCASKTRQARRLSELLGAEVDPGWHTSLIAEDDRVLLLDEHQHGFPLVVDDGPLHPFWAGPGPMPDWLRDLGCLDFSEPDQEEEGDGDAPTTTS